MRNLELAVKYLAGERLQGTAAERAALTTSETGKAVIDTTSSSGNTIITFKSDGTFTPTSNFNIEYVVVGGGGGAGTNNGGGGGAGGVKAGTGKAVTQQTYDIRVGYGSSGTRGSKNPINGMPSQFTPQGFKAWEMKAGKATLSHQLLPTGTAAFTIMFWVRFRDFFSAHEVLRSGNANDGIELWTNTSGLHWTGNGDNPTLITDSQANAIGLDKWFHIAISRNGSGTDSLYINGAAAPEDTSVSSKTIPSITDWHLGGRHANNEFFGGDMSQVLVYTSAKSLSDIQAVYNSGNGTLTPSTTNLQNYYDFTQIDKVLEDQQGSNNGTMTYADTTNVFAHSIVDKAGVGGIHADGGGFGSIYISGGIGTQVWDASGGGGANDTTGGQATTGYNGGNGTNQNAGGGGGSASNGVNASNSGTSGTGGNGTANPIVGSTEGFESGGTYYLAGGGGGASQTGNAGVGTHGGGNGAGTGQGNGASATGVGSGAGGGTGGNYNGGKGSDGIVIIKFPTAGNTYTFTGGGVYTKEYHANANGIGGDQAAQLTRNGGEDWRFGKIVSSGQAGDVVSRVSWHLRANGVNDSATYSCLIMDSGNGSNSNYTTNVRAIGTYRGQNHIKFGNVMGKGDRYYDFDFSPSITLAQNDKIVFVADGDWGTSDSDAVHGIYCNPCTQDSGWAYDGTASSPSWSSPSWVWNMRYDSAGTVYTYPNYTNGTIFEESDTGKHYMFDGTSAWNEIT